MEIHINKLYGLKMEINSMVISIMYIYLDI